MIIKSYEILKNSIKFKKFNLFLLYGENEGLKKDIKKKIEEITNQKKTDLEFITLYEKDIIENNENFYNSIYSGSLFSVTKIIVIHDSSDKLTNLLDDIVSKYPKNVFIIFLSNILEKKSKLRKIFETNNDILCIPCYPDNNKDLESIARSELKKSNVNISQEIINLLIEKSNNDRNNLRNEIEKIQSFALNKKKIEIDEIKSIINFAGEYKSDSLINECLCGNVSEYKKILAELYTNSINQIFLFRILNNKIQRLLKMKENEKEYNNLDNLINSTKPPIFWKDKSTIKKQLTIWNLTDLKKIILESSNTELLCKKNPQVSNAIFFNFFTKLCKKANNFS